jgi:hypothetical protein
LLRAQHYGGKNLSELNSKITAENLLTSLPDWSLDSFLDLNNPEPKGGCDEIP